MKKVVLRVVVCGNVLVCLCGVVLCGTCFLLSQGVLSARVSSSCGRLRYGSTRVLCCVVLAVCLCLYHVFSYYRKREVRGVVLRVAVCGAVHVVCCVLLFVSCVCV